MSEFFASTFLSKLATDAETVTGTSTTKAVTPANLTAKMAAAGAIGGTTPAAGAFTTLSASSTVSGSGFSTYLASPPAIGGTAAGTIRGLVDEDVETATDSISVNQCAGALINNFGQTDDAILTLPAAAAGYHFTVCLGTTVAKYFRILPLNAANDSIYLDGVTTGDDKYVQIASAVLGACIQFFTFQTGAAAYDWYAVTVSGAWVAEA